METTVAVLKINKSSQTTIPKAARLLLGVKLGDKLVLKKTSKKNSLLIEREPSLDERLEVVRKSFSPETKSRINQTREKFKNNPQAQIEWEKNWRSLPNGKSLYSEKYTKKETKNV